MSEGFLHRWSRRKMQGETAPPEEVRPAAEAPAAPPVGSSAPAIAATAPDQHDAAQQAQPPAPTLQDAQALTPESDFKPFVARNVAPEVRNAAMKTLFSDPHFNVMDGLDVYIDDYSKPTPLPAAVLQKMASAAFLKLVEVETPPPTSVQDVAQSEHSWKDPSPLSAEPTEGTQPASQETDDDHADLRLQQDDAAGGQDPRRGTS